MAEPVIANTPVDELPRGRGQASEAPAVQRPGEVELVDWVEELFTDAVKGREDAVREESWSRNKSGYYGDVWGDTDLLPSFKPPIVVNELQSLILQDVSDLTDSPIKVFVQKDRSKPDRDKQVEKCIQAFFTRELVDQKVMYAALDAEVFPVGFLTVNYNPSADNGRGKLEVHARDPRTVFPDPDATSDDDWLYVFYEDVMDLVTIRANWPDHGHRVRPEAAHSLPIAHQGTESRGLRGLSGRYQGPLYSGGGMGPLTSGFSKGRAAVKTLFIRDDQTEDDFIERMVEQINEQTGEKTLTKELVATKKKTYPNGRLIQVANGVVLFDGQNPYPGRFPIVRVCLQPALHSFYPMQSILAGVLEGYICANKLDSLVAENGLRLNGGTLIAPTNSGIDPAKWANIPGQAILVPPGMTEQVKILYPPAMPADMVNAGEKIRAQMRNVLGMRESRIGAGQRGNVSPELTETEINQAMGLTRLRGRLLHSAVQKLVEIIFAGMAVFYKVPRVIPHVRGDQWEPVVWEPIASPDAYAVHVDPSSFRVMARTAMQRLYLTLARVGMMPTDEVLNMLEIPNAQEVAAKLKEELMLKALANVKQKGKKRG